MHVQLHKPWKVASDQVHELRGGPPTPIAEALETDAIPSSLAQSSLPYQLHL